MLPKARKNSQIRPILPSSCKTSPSPPPSSHRFLLHTPSNTAILSDLHLTNRRSRRLAALQRNAYLAAALARTPPP
ncbi:MAG TPA: hypothetical protein VM008_11580 [Phycisphaerae bacterium]|nr:hypothetical protein [Phycisphaerae bacterium]